MKNVFLFVFSLSLILISCGKISPKGDILSKDIEVEDFTKLELHGKFRVFYVHGNKNFINVETYPNIFDNLKIKVSDKNLSISEKRETKGVDFYNITIYSKNNLENISVSDSVEMNISSAINVNNFKLNLKNNAKFIGVVNATQADLEMMNTSRANLNGFVKNSTLKISDTASIIAPYWQLDNLNLQAKNGSYTEVNVKDSLKGNVSNTARLLYYNNPIRAFKIDKNTIVQNKILE